MVHGHVDTCRHSLVHMELDCHYDLSKIINLFFYFSFTSSSNFFTRY